LSTTCFCDGWIGEVRNKNRKGFKKVTTTKKTLSTKDASGKTVDKKAVDVDVDSKGNTDKTTKTKHVHSTGLFHKDDKVTTKDTEKTKDGQVTTTHRKEGQWRNRRKH